MRVQLAGVRRTDATFRFFFEGEPVSAWPGESLAAALVAAGIYGLRQGRSGDLRGVFCGMGVCGECQVLVDGHSRRACMEPAMPGLQVSRHPARVTPTEVPAEPDDGAWTELSPDVLVIGAGPAGLSAAETAAKEGLDVLVLDERRYPGGQYFKQPGSGFAVDEHAIDGQFAAGRRLIERAEAAGVQLRPGVTAWGAFDRNRIAAAGDEGNLLVAAKRIVLSPGAYERALPVPGWTLPGVMTTGAAQTLLRAYQTAPGRRVLIAGNGPLNLQVAYELCRAGVEVAAVAELAAPPWRAPPGAALAMSLSSPRLTLTGIRHCVSLARHGVPLLYRRVLSAVEGGDSVECATVASVDAAGKIVRGLEQRFDVDAVCVNYGFLPQSELARALDCEFEYDAGSGQLRARRAVDGRSSVPEVFIVGDAGGLGGAKLAAAQGQLAGLSIVQDLRPSTRGLASAARRVRRRRRRDARFQDALWTVFQAPFLTTQLAQPGTPVCRCEDVPLRSLERLLRNKEPGLAAIKKATRAGMGRCQGRYCATLIAAMAAQDGAARLSPANLFAPRPPAKPIAAGWLATPCGSPLQARDVNSTTGRNANKSS